MSTVHTQQFHVQLTGTPVFGKADSGFHQSQYTPPHANRIYTESVVVSDKGYKKNYVDSKTWE